MPDYLHNHKDFSALLNIVAEEKGIQAGLVEKDYWIMHVLYGLKSQGFSFELKGGTSLSKGYKVIHRFSEDIDIHIKPPDELGINENPKNNNKNNVAKRKEFYDWLAGEIKIPGINSVVRDTAFDDETSYRSGGIRLIYDNTVDQVHGMKEGILLETGFDDVTPNTKITISSWAYDKAIDSSVDIIDNRGVDIVCYHPGYTFVEKLQTIATKFRQEQNGGARSGNFMRQYYDVYCLLEHPDVLGFIGTAEYTAHKQKRFPKADLEIPISKNEAFLLTSEELRADFTKRYKLTAALYYQGQPEFEALLKRIAEHCHKL
ncbi:MAG: nucleotidyl transferase AbiEii/AbiGii toxin family protein [Bacteroidia bacterium]|nr:nucleotidyl transferase AbiEii/AbiGii toxin family protein [Bacteroidia bacterium]MBP7259700.1 nucleotidyl transferase AbiEii/AbiGii toxin family protein [Bacteroidia bacterium]MBP9179397.1 nucleotidyl transferase AbiEii/AbiGii toxin family protein [Bacteroidia bacterium]MBP9723349.1 nucleotidyl transferase AbiEii/AbiGii toxin family protein [Bacteroidia bacterium]